MNSELQEALKGIPITLKNSALLFEYGALQEAFETLEIGFHTAQSLKVMIQREQREAQGKAVTQALDSTDEKASDIAA